MAYPYPHRTRVVHREVHGNAYDGVCSAGTITFNVNTPAGGYAFGLAVAATGNDQPIVINVQQWADHEQTILASTKYKFLLTGATTATTNLTIGAQTATGTTGRCGVLIPAGDQYGAAAPVLVVHGAQVTISTTATVGTYELAWSGVEL